jgi:hypothetical protein
MAKEMDQFMGTHVMEERNLFSAATDCHITIQLQVAATTGTLQ